MYPVLTLRTPLGLPARQYRRRRVMVVSSFSTIEQRPRVTAPAPAHAKQTKRAKYIMVYRRSEHRTPTLIYERVNEDPGTLLRTTPTRIPRANRTDVETLRVSFGVRAIAY
ncbi:hypothetical protein EDB89DRAFT_2033144 [Lactarius sanguifluus]|nr:hypothetical protein EDB89DRAFT_2033144 [Lactarius sanguifluus]